MSAAGHRKQLKGAIAALTADVAGWRKQIVATEALIADLAARAGTEVHNRAGTVPAQMKPLKAKRRRRRRRPTRPIAAPGQRIARPP